MPITLDTKIDQLTRVGKSTAAKLSRLGVRTAGDLLRHYPFRYDDFGLILPIAKLRPGATATVRGRIELIANRRSPRRRMLLTEAIVADATGSISAVWFHQPYLTRQFRPGDEVYLAGQVTDEFRQLQFVSPQIEPCKQFTLHTARLVPIYPATEGITQRQLRFLVQQALPAVRLLEDPLPAALRAKQELPTLGWAIQQVHFPQHSRHLQRALRRLKFDELFALQLSLQRARRELRRQAAMPVPFQGEATKRFVAALGFSLTADQRQAAWQILQDLGRPYPMNRLLEGEVGAGKTVVVAIAALNVALAGGQTAVMAPTEILAEQHYRTFHRLFAGWPVGIGLLTRSRRALTSVSQAAPAEGASTTVLKRNIIARLKRGELPLVVGTHALLAEHVAFKRLTLVAVDEQHRFGVAQRQQLKSAAGGGGTPHFLSLTATPIPRSLALVLYGDLAISAIRQLPNERKPILTRLVAPHHRPQLVEFIRNQVVAGRQAFVVCPLIDPSDALGVRAATAERDRLQQQEFRDLRIAVLHGKLSGERKAATMAAFQQGEFHILVTTTVVEVGVDVPNATTMVVEGAERFGLSQLHQLRGRVGRSAHQSYCFLCTETFSGEAYERLAAFLKAKDGFELAELDLKFRGPGELLGRQQSGFHPFRLASLADVELAQLAQAEATRLLSADPALQRYPLLVQLARTSGGEAAHLE